MRRHLLSVAIVCVLVTPAWVSAEFRSGGKSSDGTIQFDLHTGVALLQGALSLADRYLSNYLDLEGQYHQGEAKGQSWGKLRFKIFPEGRTHSDSSEVVDAETWFNADQDQWSFHFKLHEPSPSLSEEDPRL